MLGLIYYIIYFEFYWEINTPLRDDHGFETWPRQEEGAQSGDQDHEGGLNAVR